MRFYKPAKNQPCFYCEKISVVEQQDDYPIREGIFTFENYIYRCNWHAQFKCFKCQKSHHFSWLYWCPKSQNLICGDCTPPTMKTVGFWDRTYAYQFFCEECDKYHYDLLYAEFQGNHPWQIGHLNIKSLVNSSKSEMVEWKPVKSREGTTIGLEDALKLPNRVNEIRKDLKNVNFKVLEHAVPENQVKYSASQESWEKNSQDWIDSCKIDMSGDINRQFIIDPALWSLLGDVKNLSVLDAGCGNGYLTRLLAKRGAKVVGVDYSQTFVDYCEQIEAQMHLGCEFYKTSLTDLKNFPAQTFDLVVSNIVMVDVLDYKEAFKEISRVLKKTGRFVWSNVHPVFGRTAGAVDIRLPRDSPRNEARYLKMIDRYFDSGGELLDWMSKPTWQFMRTLEEYSKALKQAGFVISEIVEPRPTPELIQQNPRALAFDADRWSHFIIYECLKLLP